jgi:hypothetical protein
LGGDDSSFVCAGGQAVESTWAPETRTDVLREVGRMESPFIRRASLTGVLALFALLAGAIGWALAAGPLSEGFAVVVSNPWGWVTLLDLYIGFVLVATWIHTRERDWRVTTAWAIALAVTGNLATLAYMLRRLWKDKSLKF